MKTSCANEHPYIFESACVAKHQNKCSWESHAGHTYEGQMAFLTELTSERLMYFYGDVKHSALANEVPYKLREFVDEFMHHAGVTHTVPEGMTPEETKERLHLANETYHQAMQLGSMMMQMTYVRKDDKNVDAFEATFETYRTAMPDMLNKLISMVEALLKTWDN